MKDTYDTWVSFLGQEDPLEKGMAIHYSILAWRIRGAWGTIVHTTGKNIALTIWTFVSKVISLLFNILSRFVITFLPMSKHLLISSLFYWYQNFKKEIGTIILYKYTTCNIKRYKWDLKMNKLIAFIETWINFI